MFFSTTKGKTSYGKAAIAYLVCEFLIRGISFISTPVFSRIMNTDSYGQFSNFVAWEALLAPVLTMNLRTTVSKSKFDFSVNNDTYLSSILATSNIITLLFWLIFELNRNFFCNWFGMDVELVRLLIIYLLLWPAFAFQQIQFQMYNKYKLYITYTIIATVLRMGLSVSLVIFMKNQLLGRVYGYIIPALSIYLIIYINIWRHGKKVDMKCVKYALGMSIPLLPSAFSATLLTSSDQVMIKYWCGSDDVAVYSIAYSISSIAGVIWTAMNQAWKPWSMECLDKEKFDEIKKTSKLFQYGYVVIIGCFMFLVPEVIMIMGGEKYVSAINLMPPVIMAMVCQFFYAFYFNVEYFYGKNFLISFGTAFAAIINVVLNMTFIPRFGYEAAAYTTLAGYFVMLVYHYSIVRFVVRKGFIYDSKSFFLSILLLACLQGILIEVYDYYLVRYILLFMYLIIISLICLKILKNRNTGKE